MLNISKYEHYLHCKLLTVPTTRLTPHEHLMKHGNQTVCEAEGP